MSPDAEWAGQGGGGWWPFGRTGPRRGGTGLSLAHHPLDTREEEINALLSGSEHRDVDFRALLAAHVRPLVQRGVPPRGIEAGPVPRTARLRFADGTTLIVCSLVPGDLAILASAMRFRSARPSSVFEGPGGNLRLVLSLGGRPRLLAFSLIGLDQPD